MSFGMKLSLLVMIVISSYIALCAELFNCRGSMNISIPIAYVNDDYCDCMETGMDEYLTNACNNGKFHCDKDDKYIPSSLVNDGICDCSNGEDEWIYDHKCEKYNDKMFEYNFEHILKDIPDIYKYILFPDYVASVAIEDKSSGYKYRANEVERFINKRKNGLDRKDKLKTARDGAFPYNEKYKPPDIDQNKNKLVGNDETTLNTLIMYLVFVLISCLGLAYLLKIRYFDKSKTH